MDVRASFGEATDQVSSLLQQFPVLCLQIRRHGRDGAEDLLVFRTCPLREAASPCSSSFTWSCIAVRRFYTSVPPLYSLTTVR